MNAPADPSFQPRFYPEIPVFLFFSFVFLLLLLIIAIMGVCSEGYKNEDFFYFLQ